MPRQAELLGKISRAFGIPLLILVSELLADAAQGPDLGTNLPAAQNDVGASTAKAGPQISEEEISFENKLNNDKLSGVLLRPSGAGPFPAIVFVHGGGNGDRNTYRPLANAFLKLGFACLLWDKPGCGKSTGDFRTELQDERMSETQAALDFMRSRNDIDPKRIGMWGTSAAGELVPQIAASGDIAFAILVSPELNFSKTLAYFTTPENMLRCKKFYGPLFNHIGISESDLGEMETFGISFVQLLAKKDVAYDEVVAALKGCHGKLWYQKLCQTGLYSDTALNWTPEYYHRFYDHDYHGDARTFLAQTRCPLLVIFGADDFKVDPVTYTQYCEEVGNKVGPGVITVKTFAGASHELTSPSDMPGKNYAPGYLDFMCTWLKNRSNKGANTPRAVPDPAAAH